MKNCHRSAAGKSRLGAVCSRIFRGHLRNCRYRKPMATKTWFVSKPSSVVGTTLTMCSHLELYKNAVLVEATVNSPSPGLWRCVCPPARRTAARTCLCPGSAGPATCTHTNWGRWLWTSITSYKSSWSLSGWVMSNKKKCMVRLKQHEKLSRLY